MDNLIDPMDNFDINQWIIETEIMEDAVDMHFSLYSVPSYYQEEN